LDYNILLIYLITCSIKLHTKCSKVQSPLR